MTETKTEKVCARTECSFDGKPQALGSFYKDKKSGDGRQRYCKKCMKEYRRAKYDPEKKAIANDIARDRRELKQRLEAEEKAKEKPLHPLAPNTKPERDNVYGLSVARLPRFTADGRKMKFSEEANMRATGSRLATQPPPKPTPTITTVRFNGGPTAPVVERTMKPQEQELEPVGAAARFPALAIDRSELP